MAGSIGPEAAKIARYLCESSENGFRDPEVHVRDVPARTGLLDGDAAIGVDELAERGLVEVRHALGPDKWIKPARRFFVEMDLFFGRSDPIGDAFEVAKALAAAGVDKPVRCDQLASTLGWNARRLNPALICAVDDFNATEDGAFAHPYPMRSVAATVRTVRRMKEGQ